MAVATSPSVAIFREVGCKKAELSAEGENKLVTSLELNAAHSSVSGGFHIRLHLRLQV